VSPRSTPKSIGAFGEERLIASIRSWLGAANPPPPRGIGDDCAVLPARAAGTRQLVTVDGVIRGKHFDDALPASTVAEKLLKRNLSDIAAMGGTPRHAVVALAAPPDLEVAWLQKFFRALGRAAVRAGVSIVGGDCAQTDGLLGAWLTLIGDAPPRPLTRTGARAGDLLFVTGVLGGSILGHHHRFTPRLAEGRWLARRPEVRAAIDLSDGLGKDLRALVPPGCGAVLDPRNVPISAAARQLAARSGRPPLEHACNDGEDYELLFAIAPARVEGFAIAWHRAMATPLSCIGRIVRGGRGGAAAIEFVPEPEREVRLRGYEHFR
jgi:thiamine-monophosphate kinase